MQIKQKLLDSVMNYLQDSWTSSLYLEEPRDACKGPWNSFQEKGSTFDYLTRFEC